jgi:DUF2891 family protein
VGSAPAMPTLDPARAGAIVEMVLACIHREYPVHMVHLVRGPTDIRAPRELTPAFYGAFDWHSAVHGHWTLARLARTAPEAPWRPAALAALSESLSPERLAGELAYLSGEGRQGFERPYGLAWLLQLVSELRGWARSPAPDDAAAAAAGVWLAALEPLETLAADRILALLERLPWPVRGGEHAQTAFALGLFLDWARDAGRDEVTRAVRSRAVRYYGADRAAPIAYEPGGHDFLSPALGEADAMRRVLDRRAFAPWLERFLPEPGGPAARRWLTPVVSPDRADGKLSHLDGLNLSRAWMLEGIASALPASHRWRVPLIGAARRHAGAGLASVPSAHYAGAHWLGSFAVYLLTRRGLGEGATGGA